MMDEDEALLALNERRAARALAAAPALIGHIRSLVVPSGSAAQDGTPRAPKSDPPLPFRADAMDDADLLFGQIVDWAAVWQRRLPVMPVLVLAWRPGDGADTQGLPASVTPAGAHSLLGLACTWLQRHHALIAQHEAAGDYFEKVASLVGGMRARYPMADRPPRRPLKRPCPVCKEQAMVARIPQDARDTTVRCENCEFEIAWESFSILVEGWLK